MQTDTGQCTGELRNVAPLEADVEAELGRTTSSCAARTLDGVMLKKTTSTTERNTVGDSSSSSKQKNRNFLQVSEACASFIFSACLRGL